MLIEDLHLILKIAEFKSIKRAADSLDMSTAAASAALRRAEKHYGVEFFVRSTRSLRLSLAGEKSLPKVQQAMALLQQVEHQVKDDLDVIEGELRLSAPSDLGRNVVLPWLDDLMDQHESLNLKLYLSDNNVDFYRDPVDIALRYGFQKDSNLIGFKICDVPRVVCAAPDYLNKYGTPKHPNELAGHNGLLYQLRDIIADVWELGDHQKNKAANKKIEIGKTFKIKMQSNRAANDAELVRRWCVGGKGIAFKSALDMARDLLSGRVEPILTDYPCPLTELWLICPSRYLVTPAVRKLREHLQNKCSALLTELQLSGVI